MTPSLKICNIDNQRGNRTVAVYVEYATETSLGAIIMKDKRTGQEIYRKETMKKETEHKMTIN